MEQLDFAKMKWYKKVYWYIKLWCKEHSFYTWETQWRVMPLSYCFTHSKEEYNAELQRRIAELRRIIDETSIKEPAK